MSLPRTRFELWTTAVAGALGAAFVPARAQAAGTVAITADGDSVAWQTTGDVGERWGLYLRHRRSEPAPVTAWSYVHAAHAAGSTTFWAQHGPGTYDVQVCEYDPFEQVLTTCSNEVEVSWVIDANGHFVAIPAADPALESGTITASLADCELSWQTTGTVGAATGFMVLSQLDADPQYGESSARYAWPAERMRSLAHLDTGRQHVAVCAYDYYRNTVGACSEPLVLDFAWGFGPTCTPVAAEPGIVGEIGPPYSEAVAAGLVAFRTPDGNGNTCAGCHAPDGIDLAYPAYSREDILRRANNHLDPQSSAAIADMIEAVRDHHGWVPTRDPREYRPLQAGGQVLPGGTAMERDAAFTQQLVDRGLWLAVGEVDDLPGAIAARDELLALDPWSLPVGIPLGRFSEDEHFGPSHHSLSEWVPTAAHVPDSLDPDTWWALQDLYLAEPSDEALVALLDGIAGPDAAARVHVEEPDGALEAFESARFRSLLLLSHEQRREMSGAAPRGAADVIAYPTNPIWETSRLAYDTWACNPVHHGDPAMCMQIPGFPPDAAFFAQMEDTSLAWHYIGFLFDQPLVDLPGEASLLSGHYMASQLKHRGYPTHNLFTRAKRAVTKYWGPDQSWRDGQYYATAEIPSTSASWDLVFMDLFMAQGGQGGHDLLYGPAAGQHRDDYLRLCANTYKMLLLLLEDEIARTGQVFGRDVLVEMLRAEAGARWYGPVDYLPVLVAHEPERAAELAAWIEGIAQAAEQAEEVSLHAIDP